MTRPALLLSARRMLGGFQYAQHLVLAQDQVFLIVDLDFGAGIFAEEDALARLDVQRDHFTLVGLLAVADSHHFTLLRFLLGCVGNDDSSLHSFLLFNTLDQDAVMKRSKSHLPVSFQ